MRQRAEQKEIERLQKEEELRARAEEKQEELRLIQEKKEEEMRKSRTEEKERYGMRDNFRLNLKFLSVCKIHVLRRKGKLGSRGKIRKKTKLGYSGTC